MERTEGKIKVGDTVAIQFANGDRYNKAKVLYIPCATGDSWHIETDGGQLVYVQSFETMAVLAKFKAQGGE